MRPFENVAGARSVAVGRVVRVVGWLGVGSVGVVWGRVLIVGRKVASSADGAVVGESGERAYGYDRHLYTTLLHEP